MWVWVCGLRPILSTLTYSHSFPSCLTFLMMQARTVSGNTSAASEEVRYVRVGERRVKKEDSSTIAHYAMPCILSFLPLWLYALLLYSTPFLPFYSHLFLFLRQSPPTLCSYFTLSLFPIPYSYVFLVHQLRQSTTSLTHCLSTHCLLTYCLSTSCLTTFSPSLPLPNSCVMSASVS